MHPYYEFEETAIWKVVDDGISELVANQDINERTLRRYIVGYLIKCMVDADVFKPGVCDK
jgi:hypothetical protein